MKKIQTTVIAVIVAASAFFITAPHAADYAKQGLSPPNGYPQDLIPLMDGYKIVAAALENKGDQPKVWVKYMVDADIDQAGGFYKNILSRGTLQYADKMGKKLYMLKGELEGKKVSVNISNEDMYDDFQSNVLITIIGNLEVSGQPASAPADVDLSNANKNLKNMDKVPGDFPIDLIPLFGNEVKYGNKSTYNGKDIFMIQVYSKKDKDQVLAVYKEALKNAGQKEAGTLSTGTHTLGGVVENYKVSLVIGDLNIEGYEYNSFVTMQVDVLE